VPLRERPLLVDTNAILEAWRVGAWKALAAAVAVETVEMCVIETQTGFQRQREEERIDQATLLASLRKMHQVDDVARAGLALQAQDIPLDPGERDLWAHAVQRDDGWMLCGPDKASLRLGVRLGFRERMVSLEELCDAIGFSPRQKLRIEYGKRWLDATLSQMVVLEGKR
jgi:hypothetical protein